MKTVHAKKKNAMVVVATAAFVIMSNHVVVVQAQAQLPVDPCFQGNLQLRNAVVEYATDSSTNTEVAGQYGW